MIADIFSLLNLIAARTSRLPAQINTINERGYYSCSYVYPVDQLIVRTEQGKSVDHGVSYNTRYDASALIADHRQDKSPAYRKYDLHDSLKACLSGE